LALSEN